MQNTHAENMAGEAAVAAGSAAAAGFAAAMLPPIMVPLVGIVFPGVAMSLWFLFSQKEDIAVG